jgi:hypothetical protein
VSVFQNEKYMSPKVEKNPTPPDLETLSFQVLTELAATERRALQIAESTAKIRDSRINLRPLNDPYFTTPQAENRRRVLLQLISGGTPIPDALKQIETPDQP